MEKKHIGSLGLLIFALIRVFIYFDWTDLTIIVVLFTIVLDDAFSNQVQDVHSLKVSTKNISEKIYNLTQRIDKLEKENQTLKSKTN